MSPSLVVFVPSNRAPLPESWTLPASGTALGQSLYYALGTGTAQAVIYQFAGVLYSEYGQRAFLGMVSADSLRSARVADLTGGWTSFLEEPVQAADIYARILADINHRYVISYYPTDQAQDGRLRKVHVEVRGHPDYVVQGRTSYYATARR